MVKRVDGYENCFFKASLALTLEAEKHYTEEKGLGERT